MPTECTVTLPAKLPRGLPHLGREVSGKPYLAAAILGMNP